ncbi:MAG: prephenate dehydratase domain-containing protein [Anaerovoracaceae bacterium]|jgi:chorismate mutase/prephenate dehydratase|nr:prephenate dehydratase domain-containing protein [Anaerovoracaceae bacterium]
MSIEKQRDILDQLDDKMVELFQKRMETVLEIAKAKGQDNIPVKDQGREREILSRLTNSCSEDLKTYCKSLYLTLFSLSRSYQKSHLSETSHLTDLIRKSRDETAKVFPKNALVACQGIEGSYSQMAADKLFSMPSIIYFNTFEGVFNAVESGLCRYGLLPIENSTSGSVPEVYDLMKEKHFHIAKSLKLKVQHSLFAKEGTSIGELKEIVSHQQALDQCSEFLKTLKGVKLRVSENTAMAAKTVGESQDRTLGAISSANCGPLYGLTTLKTQIENHSNNYTRFICISKELEIYPDGDRISLILSVPHEPGALFDLLSKFAAKDINVSKIESRPIPGTDFEFMFYFDLEASVYEEAVIMLMGELDQTMENFEFLGCYGE